MVVWLVAAACADPAPLKAFAAPSWTDVPQHGLPSHLTGGVELDAARGEREGAWVVLQPQGAWSELDVEVTELALGKRRLAPERLHLRRAYFERAPDGRILADAVVPLERSTLRDPRHPESSNLPLWLEVHVPGDARPGLYAGTVRLRVGCEAAELPISVRVHRVRVQPRGATALVGAPDGEGRRWSKALATSAKAAQVNVLQEGQGGGGVDAWQIPIGDREAIGLGLGAPATSGAAVAWLSERERADLLVYPEAAAGLGRSLRHPQALWYPVPGTDDALVETVRLLRLRDALELRALIAATRRGGHGREVDRWSEKLTPPGGHASADPDAYAAARRALLLRSER